MRRVIILFGLLLSVSQTLYADNLMVGVAVINQEVDIKLSTGSTQTEDGSGFGIYADYYYQGKYRFNGTFSYVDYTDFYITTATLAADYLIPINPNVTLFAGVAGGGAGQSYSDASATDMAIALLYGVQFGGIMFVNEHLMLELGYRIRSTDLETEFTNTTTTATVEDMNETYLSLIVMF
ncbi:MAG: hypothetical protein EP315_04865 [Gammaproteobacteria bacterium]|nr:MAG: hypothetical protein EP315_04865 [Gammaproteobacteria bacterium]